jgi:predicted Zn finger-like uncharacterized protein
MIIQCPDCTTRYEIDASRVPPGRIRVRCARCQYVFPIEADRGVESPEAVTPDSTDQDLAQDRWAGSGRRETSRETPVEPMGAAEIPEVQSSVDVEPMEGIEATRIENVNEPAPTPGLDLEIERPGISRGDSQATREAASEPAQSATITQESAGVSPADQKAKRLARALVSDILVYNREKRDKALADGTLVQALGQEIKKSWELYKERVTPEAAASSNHFKDALNEILADGQKIF